MIPTPRDTGYRMPAEWETHAATWLSWPHNVETWPGKFDKIPIVFAQVVRLLCPGEQVHINVINEDMEERVRRFLERHGAILDRVVLHRIPTNDAWCRDHGPVFLVRDRAGERELAAVDWIFNSWGNKYPPFDLDNGVPAGVAEALNIPCFSAGIVLEGGSIDVNGAGSLITTESCLLNSNRNPGLSREEIERHLKDFLGITHVLWLGSGIAGDDTDGHVDDLTRFVDSNTVVTATEEDPADENFVPLQDNLRRLASMTDQSAAPLRIVTLPMPPPRFHEGQRLPCSYVNFYIGNRVVLLPTFDCQADEVARQRLQSLFSSRRVVGIDCTDLVSGLGTLHCITQQQPAAALQPGRQLSRKLG